MAGILRIVLVDLALIFATSYAQQILSSTLSTASSSSPSTSSNSCPSTGIATLQSCYATYFAALNLPLNGAAAPTFQNYFNMKRFIARAGGAANFTRICQAVNTRNSCIGQNDPSCINIVSYQQALNVSMSDAAMYVATYGSDKWACNAGLQLIDNNIYCIESVYFNHPDEWNACTSIFLSGLQQNTITCSTGSTILSCQQNLFQKYCQNSGSTYGCQIARGNVQAFDGNQCDSQLPTCPTSS